MSRDGSYAWNTWTWARLQSSKGRGKVYLYYFDVRTPTFPGGARHGDELAYVFGNFDSSSKIAAHSVPRSEDLHLSDLIRRYWINFASNGDPNGPGLPVWPTFSEGAQRAMVFDHSPGARPLPNIARLRAFDSYYRCMWKGIHEMQRDVCARFGFALSKSSSGRGALTRRCLRLSGLR